MKSFKSFISEEVLPTANVENGNFDLENDSVRAEVNAILAGICSHSHVTPYITLRKVSKALAYFSIILPKRTFLEGDKGVEVYEIRQFGERMGMTDQGEFVREIPVQYHLFFQYVQIMGRFIVTAKVVDKAELDKMLDTAEMVMKECWDKVTKSEREAIKEPIHTDGNNGTVSTKKAMDTSERTKDKKLASGKLDKEWPAVVKEDEQIDEGKTDGSKMSDMDKHRHGYAMMYGRSPTQMKPNDKLASKVWNKPSSEMRKTKSGKIHGQDQKAKASEIKSRLGSHTKPGHLPEDNLDEADYKSSYAYKKMKTKVATKVKRGLGIGKEKTSTVLVTNKGDPKAATGGGVHRIPKDKYDPSKHNLASE